MVEEVGVEGDVQLVLEGSRVCIPCQSPSQESGEEGVRLEGTLGELLLQKGGTGASGALAREEAVEDAGRVDVPLHGEPRHGHGAWPIRPSGFPSQTWRKGEPVRLFCSAIWGRLMA